MRAVLKSCLKILTGRHVPDSTRRTRAGDRAVKKAWLKLIMKFKKFEGECVGRSQISWHLSYVPDGSGHEIVRWRYFHQIYNLSLKNLKGSVKAVLKSCLKVLTGGQVPDSTRRTRAGDRAVEKAWLKLKFEGEWVRAWDYVVRNFLKFIIKFKKFEGECEGGSQIMSKSINWRTRPW